MKTKERPILMSGPMVRAILAGAKTQTRRVVNPQPLCYSHKDWPESPDFYPSFNKDGSLCCGICMGQQQRLTKKDVTGIRNPYGKPGDRLWVRESFCLASEEHRDMRGVPQAFYMADAKDAESEAIRREYIKLGHDYRWRPSIHMPRWACRLELEIVAVRVERLQEIEADDCACEGLQSTSFMPPLKHGVIDGYLHAEDQEAVKRGFQSLWESINGLGSWALNPWVWVVEFRRVEPA